MNEFVKIKSDIDDETAKKIKALLKDFKKSQDETIEKIAVILLNNMDDSGTIMLSDSMVLSIQEELTLTLNKLNESEVAFLNSVLEGGYDEAFKNMIKKDSRKNLL